MSAAPRRSPAPDLDALAHAEKLKRLGRPLGFNETIDEALQADGKARKWRQRGDQVEW